MRTAMMVPARAISTAYCRLWAAVCNSCHDYDVDPVNGRLGLETAGDRRLGPHALHINHLKAVSGVTLSATGRYFKYCETSTLSCGVCHTRNSSDHVMGGSPIRSINFGNVPNYLFTGVTGTPTYTGVAGVSSATTPKTCSNVSCHFQASPVWEGL